MEKVSCDFDSEYHAATNFARPVGLADLAFKDIKNESIKFRRFSMKFSLVVLLSSIFLIGFAGSATAQELIGIKIEPVEATVGKSVQITVDLKASTVVNGACGLLVHFGDGASQQIRAENNSLPVTITRTYINAGSVVVSVEGKLYARGLNSVFGCFGKNQTAALNVRAEDPSEKEAAELAAKNEAVKRATADRKAADAAAKSAASDRAATEAAALKAKNERAAADSAAKRAATARVAAEQNAANSTPPKVLAEPSVKRADVTINQPPRAAAQPTIPSVTPKAEQPKAKSSLDL